MCKGIDDIEQCLEEILFVYDVYEVQKLGFGMEDVDYVCNFLSVELYLIIFLDCFGKLDLYSFDRGDRDYESELEFLCFIYFVYFDEDVDDLDKDFLWEDL